MVWTGVPIGMNRTSRSKEKSCFRSVIEDRLYDLEMICLSILRTSKHSTAIQLKNWFLFLECQS
jgi:hypothetical protein